MLLCSGCDNVIGKQTRLDAPIFSKFDNCFLNKVFILTKKVDICLMKDRKIVKIKNWVV